MGALFLIGYILAIGVATFLLKFSLKSLSAYQLNLLMALGMLVIGLPALWIAQKSFSIPLKQLPLGGAVGLLMAAGSIFFILSLSKLPAGLASAVAGSYVVVVLLLSRMFLQEPLDWLKGLGIALTLAGVAILAYKGY